MRFVAYALLQVAQFLREVISLIISALLCLHISLDIVASLFVVVLHFFVVFDRRTYLEKHVVLLDNSKNLVRREL